MDAVRLNFSPESLIALNIVLALVMFGVALDMKLADFKSIAAAPRAVIIALLAQFFLLPATAWALGRLTHAGPSIALGLILVASCPGGNISNFLTHLARGNTALSVTLTACSTMGATFFTPFNTALWGGLNPAAAELLRDFSISPLGILGTITVLLALPAALGMTVAARYPDFAERARRPARIFAIVAFAGFILIALVANWPFFVAYAPRVMPYVLVLNALGLAVGYAAAWLSRLPEADRRAVSIEVGVQNSGLGLVLVFNFFAGLGGMAIVSALWGIWHVLAGLSLATWWCQRAPRVVPEPA